MNTDESPAPRAESGRFGDKRRSSAASLPASLTSAVRYVIDSHELAGTGPVPRQIAVTSALHKEGVTTISQALAAVLADDFEASVCLVDLSRTGAPRRPGSKSKRRREEAALQGPGLLELLSGEISPVEAVTSTGHPRIDLLRAGSASLNNHSFSPRSHQLDRAIASLEAEYDFVVMDLPPVLGSTAVLPLFRFAEAYLLVVRSGVTQTGQVRSATGLLDEIPQLGTILNHDSKKVPRLLRRLGAD
jgi:succinoglycan biosynthesis transport protein ExoP